jgi:hypothetical protein
MIALLRSFLKLMAALRSLPAGTGCGGLLFSLLPLRLLSQL